MAIHKAIENFSKVYQGVKGNVIFINDLPNFTEEQRKYNNKLLFTEFTTDILNTAPMCLCMNEKLQAHRFVGCECEICGTKVVDRLNTRIESLLWMRAPKQVNDFINIIVWNHLRDYLSVSKNDFDLLLWLTCTDVHFPKYVAFQEEILALGIERGYNNFTKNFMKYLQLINTTSVFRRAIKREAFSELIEVLKAYKDCVFTNVLPVINSSLMVMTSESKGRYVDKTAPMCMDAVRLLLGVEHEKTFLRSFALENRVAKMLNGLCAFYHEYFRSNLASKTGLIRKHMGSARSGWTMRCVITSVTKPCRYDRLELPWGPSVGMLRSHLQNRLSRYGMTTNETFGILSAVVTNHHPLIKKIFADLIDESPEKAIIGTFTRNPSLHRSSMQRMGAHVIKDDPEDTTIGLPGLSVVGFNADYDGDGMAFAMAIDNDMADQLMPLAPHKSCMEISSYRSLSPNVFIPKPVEACLSASIASGPLNNSSNQSLMAQYA